MGLRAGLTEITADAFEQAARGGDPDNLTAGERHSIDKAWDDFHLTFGRCGPPLSLAISGDCLHPMCPQSLDEFREGNHDYYVGFMSPRLVREIADVLSRLPLSQLRQWYDELGVGGYDHDFSYFLELKTAYVDAAAHGNALIICIT